MPKIPGGGAGDTPLEPQAILEQEGSLSAPLFKGEPNMDTNEAATLLLWEAYSLVDDAVAQRFIAMALEQLARGFPVYDSGERRGRPPLT